MKNNILHTIKLTALYGVAGIMAGGCSYLDVDPELGLTQDEVFETYKNYRSYFDWVYESNGGKNMERIHISFPFYYDLFQSRTFSWYQATDAVDCGLLGVSQLNFKQGILSQELIEQLTFDVSKADYKPIVKTMFSIIRRCNIAIQNIDLCKNATEEERNDLLGQAYFLRAYAHFTLSRQFGGMPYIDHTLEAGDEWDLPRLSNHEAFTRVAEDFYTAYEYFKAAGILRRNSAADLASKKLLEPAGAAALGLRARALLYAASPLSNKNGIEDWKAAATAAAEALEIADEAEFDLLPKEKYTQNFVGMETTNETIWGWSYLTKQNHKNFMGILCYPQSYRAGAGGNCPTQNFVDRFETLDGDLLITEEDRRAAIEAGHYNEQNPYANRDPRLNLFIVHDGSTQTYVKGLKKGAAVNIHYNPETKTYPTTNISNTNLTFGIAWGSKDNDKNGYSNTGYYCNKYWYGQLGSKNTTSIWHIDPLLRVADLYLMYAEAVNEAYGPSGTAENYPLTAREAFDIVRKRIGMPRVKSTVGQEEFRLRIQNERCVELAYEGHHYYYDIRRWKTAPEVMSKTLYGIYIESVPVSEEHPIGRKFERRPLPNNRQSTWKDYMYYFPFPDSEMYKLKNFVNYEWK